MGLEIQHFALVPKSIGFGEGELLFRGRGVETMVGSVQVSHTILCAIKLIRRG